MQSAGGGGGKGKDAARTEERTPLIAAHKRFTRSYRETHTQINIPGADSSAIMAQVLVRLAGWYTPTRRQTFVREKRHCH